MTNLYGVPLTVWLIERDSPRPNVNFENGIAEYITFHETGNFRAGANAAMTANWAFHTAPHSWHFTNDDREAYQHLRVREQGWHAGDGSGPGNTTSIAIECCVNDGIDQEKAYDYSARIIAYLLDRGHGAQGVVQHNYWKSSRYPNGKNCPYLMRQNSGRWEQFLKQVESYRGYGKDTQEDMNPDELERMEEIARRAEQAYKLARESSDNVVGRPRQAEADEAGGSFTARMNRLTARRDINQYRWVWKELEADREILTRIQKTLKALENESGLSDGMRKELLHRVNEIQEILEGTNADDDS